MKNKVAGILRNKLLINYQSVKFVSSINKKYLLLVFMSELIGSLKILPYMYLLKVAVNLLTEISSFKSYLLSISIILLIILFLELSNTLINKFKSAQKIKLDFAIKEQMIEKNDSIDYYTLSTKEYFLLKTKALEGYEHGCIEENVSLVFSIISNIILLVGLMFTISSLGLALLLPVGITIGVRVMSEYFDRKANYIRTSQMAEINRKSNYLHHICENIHFAKEIRVFNLEDKFDDKLEEVSNEKNHIWEKYMKIFRYSSATYIIADIILQLVIYLILAYRVLVIKTITVGDFVYFFSAYQKIQDIMGSLASNNINIFLNANYLEDFMRYWLYKPNKSSMEYGNEKLCYMDKDDIIIEFHDVSFRYPNTDFDAISNINIKIRKGESYLIVGKNGSGKSTFIKLLCRLYSPTSGFITLNGKNIKDYDRQSYLTLFSVLFQDYKTIDLTIKDNITSISESVNYDAFRRATINADIFDKIKKMPKAESTSYSKSFDENGTEFSGGEAQKMMIAKTLYKNAPIYIFDEPTAGLDAISEYKIYENIKQTSSTGILIYITHRLSTGVNSGNILVFSNGKITERGNHIQLMNHQGIYASLFKSQATLYEEVNVNE